MSNGSQPPPAGQSIAYGFRYMQGYDSLLQSIDCVEREAAAIVSRDQLSSWVQGPLRALIPHPKALVGFGHIGYSTARIDVVHAVALAGAYAAAMVSGTRQPPSPLMTKWLQLRGPQIFLPADFCRIAHDRWLGNLHRHQIENGLFDASVESYSGRMCFIKLFNVKQPHVGNANVLAQCVTPLLADIWKRIETQSLDATAAHPTQVGPPLTAVEREVYRWLREGKTNWEIGRILGKSEFTVKNQVASILRKTNVVNRAALVAIKQ